MAELAGVMVGNYFLLECLSSEGMVETYLARPTTHGGYDVYLRLFRPRFPDPLAFQEHFPAEVRKVWRCQHEHIQPLTEFGTGDDVLYTASRTDDAPTLAQVLEKRGSNLLPIPLIANWFTQLCEALQYAHDQQIVHGNLQPASILLYPENQIRLTHFAFRRVHQEGDPTVAQIDEGNAAYVAPEQVIGMLAPASDIYALGVLLYRLLGGILPYDGEIAGEIAMLHASEPLPSLRALRPEIPEALEMVVQMALAKNVEARFRSPHAFAVALMQALVRDSPPAIAVTPARRIAVIPRRTSLTWSRAFSLLALVLIMLGLSSTLYLFTFSGLPFSPLRGLSFHAGEPGSLPVFFPAIPPFVRATATQPGGIAGTQPTTVRKPPETPGQQTGSTPVVTTTPVIQQSPIVFPLTPTASSTETPPVSSLTCVPGSLALNGSFYLAPLLQQVGEDYQTVCPGLQLSVGDQGCRAGLKALEQGQANLATSDLSVQSVRVFTDYPVAALLYAVVVSPDVQISGLSSQQLQAIYQGQITNWSQVGGPDEAISVLLHPSSDPLTAILQTFVLNNVPAHVRGIKLSKKLTPEQVVQKAAQMSGAITAVSLAVAGEANVHILALNRALPTWQSVQQGSYPLWSVEHFYAVGSVSAQAQAYMQFFQAGPEANRLAQAGAFPLDTLSSVVLATHLPGPMISV